MSILILDRAPLEYSAHEENDHRTRLEIFMSGLGEDFYTEVKKGNVDGHVIVHKFGRNAAVANGVWENISLLSAASSFLSAATTVRVKAGGNAADDTAGAGAQAITVVGIDTTLAEVEETIVLAGASASAASAASFWRPYRMYIADGRAGAYGGANTGIITLENSGGGTDLIQIDADTGQSQFGAYTVPIGKEAYWLSAHVMVDASKPADIRFFQRRNFDDVTTPFEPKRLINFWDGVSGHMNFKPRSPGGPFPAGTDLFWEAQGSGAGTEVSIDFELLLVG